MSTITTINSGDLISASRSVINTNFSNLNTDKAELSGGTFTGDISVPDEAYGVGWNGSTEVPTKNAIYDKIETMGGGGVTDHGALTGLADDDHTQYSRADGTRAFSAKVLYSSHPTFTTDTELVDKKYVDDAVVAGGGYTDEQAQDAVGTILVDSSTIDFTYNDATPSITASVIDDSITFAKVQNITTNRILGRSTAGTGDVEELNVTAIPALIGLGTSDSPQFAGVNVGHATDTTISRVSAGRIAVEGVNVPTISSTDTLINKTLIANTNVISENTTTASSATPTPTGESLRNYFTVTALAVGATFSAPSGTPVDGNMLFIRVKDNATARTLAFNAIYRFSSDLPAPTTTILSKTLYMLFVYNNADSKWDCIDYINNI